MVIMGIVIVVGLVNIYLMIPTFFIGIVCYYIKNIYLPTSRSLKRLEGTSKKVHFLKNNLGLLNYEFEIVYMFYN